MTDRTPAHTATAATDAAEPTGPVSTSDIDRRAEDVVARVLARAGTAIQDSSSAGYTDYDGEQLDVEERGALQRVAGLSTELADVTEVEYRQLRLERVVLVGLYSGSGPHASESAEISLRELAALAETAGSQVLDGVLQRRHHPDPGTYLGSGKAAELADVVAATGADTVIVDTELAPSQRRGLEDVVKVKVVDRTALILDIFAQHASSREGKAQVALAQMEYMLPRLRGWGESMSRQAGGRAGSNGGVGLRGPGETKIETDRRRIRERMAKLRRQIREMRTARVTKRSARLRGSVPRIAVAGYTNAGKSSLVNAMTGSGVLVQDALFATLDPTTRRATLDDGRELVFTDTVGFVRHLPTQLVEAFRSTLEEVVDADLVLHVVDGSDPFPAEQITAVRRVINDVVAEEGVAPPPELLVINKIDAIDASRLTELRAMLGAGGSTHGPNSAGVVFVSARTGEGLPELFETVREFVGRDDVELVVDIPFTRGDLVSRIHREGEVLSTDHSTEGTRMRVRVPSALAGELASLAE